MFYKLTSRIAVVTIAVVIAMSGFGPAASAGNRTDEVARLLAGEIVKFLNNHSQESVSVGHFESPPGSGKNLQIQQRLREHLSDAKGITVVSEADPIQLNYWTVRGSYAFHTQSGQTLTEVTVRIFNDQNVEQHSFSPFPFKIEDTADIAVIAAASFDATDSVERSDKAKVVAEKLTAAIEKPQIEVKDGRISATPESPYGVEFLISEHPGKVGSQPIKSHYKPAPDRVTKKTFHMKDGTRGLAVADLGARELYAIRFYNDSDADVAVRIFIDGLSSFEFSEISAYRKNDVWIIPRRSSGVVYGWHRTNEVSDSFEVAHFPDTAVGQRNRGGEKVGTVHAMFFQAWSADEPTPAGEYVLGGVTADVLGTKQGEEIQTSYVEQRRHIGKTPIASVCVRYAKPIDDLPPGVE
jgi:hypothetical protein